MHNEQQKLTFLISDCEILKWRNANDSLVNLKTIQVIEPKLGSLRNACKRTLMCYTNVRSFKKMILT